MPTHKTRPKHQTALRHEAEARLNEGAAPPTRGWSLGKDALSLLYGLARNPATSANALKLLHELQVHQVELDLQHEQMEQNLNELSEVLARYVELYEFAPVGYFIVDSENKVIESNQAGANLFGIDCAELSGQRIDSFLTPASGPALLALLKRLRIGSKETCELQTGGGEGAARCLQVVATISPNSGEYLLAFMDTITCQELNQTF
ncbi:PAS domain-containing protein [Nitrosomonas sp.]|uniref:PAS domain-containing protein n=1 Tax=Nitrosomonas sp. TaxID=42353 RepID=UPI00261D9D97|nr:PAS domain-containing protein [Nitrosomonas sp.]MCW5601476.1 PAS domain S-box protein [Nitrosomonas sp.]